MYRQLVVRSDSINLGVSMNQFLEVPIVVLGLDLCEAVLQLIPSPISLSLSVSHTHTNKMFV